MKSSIASGGLSSPSIVTSHSRCSDITIVVRNRVGQLKGIAFLKAKRIECTARVEAEIAVGVDRDINRNAAFCHHCQNFAWRSAIHFGQADSAVSVKVVGKDIQLSVIAAVTDGFAFGDRDGVQNCEWRRDDGRAFHVVHVWLPATDIAATRHCQSFRLPAAFHKGRRR